MGLVSSARILAQRPTASPNTVSVQSVPSASAVPPLAPPPLSQETIREQIRAQVLAAPSLKTYRTNQVDYKLSDAVVSQVSYDSKEDSFLVILDWVWQPATLSDAPQHEYVALNNNGYNQYVGTVVLRPASEGIAQNATVTVK